MNLRQRYKKLKQSFFADVKRIIVETDEENPTPIAVLSAYSKDSEPVKVYSGYRVRFSLYCICQQERTVDKWETLKRKGKKLRFAK